MAIEVVEEFMGLGSWSIDLDYSPTVYDELFELVDGRPRPRKNHVLVYDADDNLLYVGLVLTSPRADENGITIGGRSPLWWLECPFIIDREYPSQAQKLSNGDYELGDLYWVYGQDTGWLIVAGLGDSISGTYVAATSGRAKDDILPSNEKFPTVPGWDYVTAAWEKRFVADVGRIRLRTVYEGRFNHPDIMPTNWVDASDHIGDVSSVGGSVTLGPCTRYSPILNSSFFGLTNWIQVAGTWSYTAVEYFAGPYSAYTAGGGPGVKTLQYDYVPATAGTVDPVPFRAHEKWKFYGAVKGDAAADGEAHIQFYVGDITYPLNPSWVNIATVLSTDSDKQNWRYEQVEFEVPDTKIGFVVMAVVYGHTAGNWFFGAIEAQRIQGNIAQANNDLVAVTAERTYKWSAQVRSGPLLTQGSLRLAVVLLGTGRPDLLMESQPIENTRNAEKLTEFTFTPPSGYNVAQPIIILTDALGDSFYVTEQSIVDNDPSTTIFDYPAASTAVHGWTLMAQATTAPEGSQFVRVEMVAEADAGGYIVDDVTLYRDDPPTPGDDIIADLLAGTSIAPGTVTCPENIPYDWRLLNLHALDALHHYCTVVSDPPREYRLNPALPPTLDVATTVGTDHAPDSDSPLVLLKRDIDVVELPPVAVDVDERPTHIRVLGADRQTVTGGTILITATAAVPGTAEVDWNGNPVERTRIVSDGTVDHAGYAQALADDLAAKEAAPAPSVTVKMNPLDATTAAALGSYTRPDCPPGDWVYVYHPEAGLQDPDNETSIEGAPAFPVRLRVLSRPRQFGPAARIVLRRTDGTLLDPLPGVIPSEEDSTTLTLGTRPLDWVSDAQGGAVGNQYLRDRASRPR